MSNNISDKDKKVWNEFIKSNEKLPNKDSKIIKKKRFKKKLIDLHGYTLDEANKTIESFIKQAFLENIHKLVVVTGKGLHSENEKDPYISKDLSILKYSVPEFIANNQSLNELIHEITDGDVLSNQWRMFKSLSNSIGEIFYGQSFDIKKVNKFDDDKLPGIFGENKERLIMADIRNSIESNRNKSYRNKAEAKFVVKHLENLLNSGCDAMALTPYKGQVAEIRSYLPKKYHNHVRTVDGFQGQEKDVIILSTVRGDANSEEKGIGFIHDRQRMNVAVTRAKKSLHILEPRNYERAYAL